MSGDSAECFVPSRHPMGHFRKSILTSINICITLSLEVAGIAV